MDYQEHTLQAYEVVMRRYLHDRECVPAGQLIEVRYENLDRDPVGTIRNIYDAFALPEIARACERVTSYCASLSGYQKNKHPHNEALRARIATQWRFAFDAFGYPT
ncbi:MAG: sulfotransferase [Verrucomicrobiaceae bacterium]|nr:sulfotransferase [Verrucomicrobiaceae bacterium]